MKAILVMDMPRDCEYCDLYSEFISDKPRCSATYLTIKNDKAKSHCPLKRLGKRVEEYGLETWTTRDGIFLCELGLFEKMYGDDEE